MTQSTRPGCVIQGFREDCAKLIARFEALETVRFEGFATIWKDLNYSLIFGGRRSLMELMEFCEDGLAVAKEFFLPPLSFKERIGGLYLLYALYFKMPVRGPKIRTKMEDWHDIMDIRAEIIQAEHHDAGYILAKLMSENAFVHCLLDRELGLERTYRVKVPKLRNTYSVLADLRELAGPGDLFDRINVLSEYYSSIKASETAQLSETEKKNSCTSKHPNLYDSSFGKKLSETVARLDNSRKFTDFGIVHETGNSRDRMGYDTSWEARTREPQKSHAKTRKEPRRDTRRDSSVSECEKLLELLDSDSSVSD